MSPGAKAWGHSLLNDARRSFIPNRPQRLVQPRIDHRNALFGGRDVTPVDPFELLRPGPEKGRGAYRHSMEKNLAHEPIQVEVVFYSTKDVPKVATLGTSLLIMAL